MRKRSGCAVAAGDNERAFGRACDEVEGAARWWIASLVTHAEPRNREVEAAKARARSEERFGARPGTDGP